MLCSKSLHVNLSKHTTLLTVIKAVKRYHDVNFAFDYSPATIQDSDVTLTSVKL
jgi:hypothetical protein